MRPAWELPPRGRGQGRRLTRTSPNAQPDPSGRRCRRGPRLRRESRRPAEARPGPELPFPPAGAARAPLRSPLLRLHLPTPREATTLRSASTGLPTDLGHREAARLRRLLRSLILAGTRCAACRDTERKKGVTAGVPEGSGGRGGPPFPLSPGGYLQPPPRARAPSGRHLLLPALPPPPPEKAPKKPPHFPSRPRMRGHWPTVRTRATSVRRAARAPSVMGATRSRGGTTAARRACRCRRPPSRDARTPAAAHLSLLQLLLPSLLSSSPTPTLGLEEQKHWGAAPGGARSHDERLPTLLPGLFSDLVARQMLPGFPARRPAFAPPRSIRKPCSLSLPSPQPLLGFLYSSRSVRFLKDTCGTTVSCGSC